MKEVLICCTKCRKVKEIYLNNTLIFAETIHICVTPDKRKKIKNNQEIHEKRLKNNIQ